MAKVNMSRLKAEIAKKGYKTIRSKLIPRIKKVLQKETQKVLEDFENHPITAEIEGGPSASNTSGTLGGYGNLFTFIGFDRGSNPISPIRSLLARSIKIQSVRKKNNALMFVLKFSAPSREEIAAVSPSPWASDSWAEAVERGMSGLGRYLYSDSTSRFNSSRSGGAIEASVEFRGASTSKATPYLSAILEKMLKSIETSLKRL